MMESETRETWAMSSTSEIDWKTWALCLTSEVETTFNPSLASSFCRFFTILAKCYLIIPIFNESWDQRRRPGKLRHHVWHQDRDWENLGRVFDIKTDILESCSTFKTAKTWVSATMLGLQTTSIVRQVQCLRLLPIPDLQMTQVNNFRQILSVM